MPRSGFVLTLMVLPVLGCTRAPVQAPVSGRWEGEVAAPAGPVLIQLDLTRTTRGLEGRMNVPEERLLGKKLRDVSLLGTALRFVIPAHAGPLWFAGSITGDSLVGVASGESDSIPIRLHYVGDSPRPPYQELEIGFTSEGESLAGSLLLPSGVQPAVVVLAHGSSTPERDDFRYYADLYARAGIAAFIYDERETGPETDGGTVPLQTLARDLEAAVAAMRARPEIDSNRVGLFGFSQGGWLVPILAARGEFAFVTVLSGPGMTYAEANRYANRARLLREGFSGPEADAADQVLARLDEFARTPIDARAMQAVLDEAHRKPWARRVALPRTVPTPSELAGHLRWIDLDFDPAPLWTRVEEPVLLLYGELDQNVPPQSSSDRIREALAHGGNRDVTVIVYPGANHELLPAPSMAEDLIKWTLDQVH